MASSILIEQLLNGLTIGVVYVLIAAGLSIIFGVMDVINFAHGELFALGAYFALSLAAPFGASGFWVALLVAPLLVGVVGMAIERLTIRPLYDRNPLYHILLTFGLVLIINDLIELGWGPGNKLFAAPPVLAGPVGVFGFTYSAYNLFIIAFGAALAGGTWWALNHTKFGLIVRAGAQDRGMVRNLGIDIDRYYTLIFGFGAMLAAAAGVVLGAQQNVSPTMGNDVIIPAFVIVVLGGMGSFRGAVAGGLGVGVIQTFTRIYVPELSGLIVYLLMIGVLVVRPQGLFGTPEWHNPEHERGELLAGRTGGFLDDRTRLLLGAAVVGLLALVPFGVGVLYSPYTVTLLTEILVWALFALSLDFVMGYTGLVSLGHTMFYGIGAYTGVLTLLHVTESAFVALALAVGVGAAVAWVVGYFSIRVSGVYFAMITLGFAQLTFNLAENTLDPWTGGTDGLFGADPLYGIAGVGVRFDEIAVGVPPFQVTGDSLFYYFVLAAVVASYLLARQLMRAPFGSVLQSIRESERRAEFIGYDVTAYKRRAFVVSGGLAGLSGGLFALQNGSVFLETLRWTRSGEVIVMTVLGGMGTLFGPMIGAAVFVGIEDALSSFTDLWGLVLGTIFVFFVIFVPGGIVSLPQVIGRYAGPRRGGGTVADSDPEVEN